MTRTFSIEFYVLFFIVFFYSQGGYTEPTTSNFTSGSASILVEAQEQILTSDKIVSPEIFPKTVAGKKVHIQESTRLLCTKCDFLYSCPFRCT